MRLDSFIPCDILKPFIKSFAISETEDESVYKILPDTGVVIGFQYKGKLSYIEHEKQIKLSSSGVTGLNDSFRIFKNSKNIGTLLVFFTETGAAHFFNQPIHELFRESVSLDNFMLRSALLILEEQLCEAKSDEDKIKAVEKFLIGRMNNKNHDSLVLAALGLIHKSKGNIRITDLMKQLNISQSPLEKRFRQVVGASPKKFASVVRFKHAIQLYNSQTSLTDLSYEAGFYDQAHFIKEFRNFAGETPETFFQKKDKHFL